MKKLLIMVSMLLLLSNCLFAAEVTKVGTTAVGFLSIDVGSRATAMGGAYVAVAQDVTAMLPPSIIIKLCFIIPNGLSI